MGLTLACQRSAIIDSAINEEYGVYRLRVKEEQWLGGQFENDTDKANPE